MEWSALFQELSERGHSGSHAEGIRYLVYEAKPWANIGNVPWREEVHDCLKVLLAGRCPGWSQSQRIRRCLGQIQTSLGWELSRYFHRCQASCMPGRSYAPSRLPTRACHRCIWHFSDHLVKSPGVAVTRGSVPVGGAVAVSDPWCDTCGIVSILLANGDTV